MIIDANVTGYTSNVHKAAFHGTRHSSALETDSDIAKQNNRDRFSNVFRLPESSGVYNNVRASGSNFIAEGVNYTANSVMNAEKASIAYKIRKFENDEDRLAIAKTAYYSMQSTISAARTANKNAIEEFNALEEEKAYYQNVLTDKNNVYQSNGKYLLENHKIGEGISEKDVKSALEDVQNRINKVIKTDTGAESLKSIISDTYSYSASVFSAATRKSSSAYNITSNDSLFGVWDRTEENFLEEADKAIDELDARSQSLDSILEGFEEQLEAKGINTKICVPTLAFQKVRNEYCAALDFINSQFESKASQQEKMQNLLQYIPDKFTYMLETA